MTTALRDELRAPVLAGIGDTAAGMAREGAPAHVPAALLPECTCILGDCDRDHDNE
jgi:hypothetical protein